MVPLIFGITFAFYLITIFFLYRYFKDRSSKITKTLDQTSKNQDQTYAKIAYERDLLSADKNKLAAIIFSIPEAVIVLDLHKQVIMANNAAEKITGFTESEMLKKRIDLLISLTNKQDQVVLPDLYCPVDLNNSGNLSFYSPKELLTLSSKANKKTKVRVIANAISGNIKADLGCVLIFHDATGDSALDTMQVDFVSMASHELRTPITSIIGYLNVLIDEGKDKFDDEQKDYLNRVLTGAQQLSSLVTNLLNVSKVERGAISINTQHTDWVKILSQAIDENKLQAVQKNISLELVDTNSSLPNVQADSVRILEVLNNLIGNALDYTSEGGSIKVSAKLQDQEIVTAIADTGKGIPPEAISKLFTKFFRVSKSQDTSSNSKGTGLGLYLSKSIIDLHHGKIWVQSQVGVGSTFYFTLPVAIVQPQETDILKNLTLTP